MINIFYQDKNLLKAIAEQSDKDSIIVLPTKRGIKEILAYFNEYSPLPNILTQEVFFNNLLETNKIIPPDFIKKYILFEAIGSAKKGFRFLDIEHKKSFFKLSTFTDTLFKFYKEILQNRVDFSCIEKESLYTDFQSDVEALKEVLKIYKELLDKHEFDDENFLKYNMSIRKIKDKKINIAISGLLTQFEKEVLDQLSLDNQINIFIKTFDFMPNKLKEWLRQYSKDVDLYKSNIEFLEVYKCKSRFETVKWINWIVKKLIKEGNKPQDIVVVLPDETLINQMKNMDNLFDFSAGFPLGGNIFVRFLEDLLETYKNSTPYGITHQDALKLSHYPFIETQLKEKALLESIVKFKLPLGEIFLNQAVSLQDTSNKILDFFKKSYSDYYCKHPRCRSSMKVLFNELKRLSLLNPDIFTLKGNPTEIIDFILSYLKSKTYPDIASNPISVVGMLESRLIQNKILIMPLINDGILPKKVEKEMFLNTYIRSNCNLPTYQDRYQLQQYHFLNIISNSKEIFLSYIETEEQTQSIFLHHLKKTSKVQEKLFRYTVPMPLKTPNIKPIENKAKTEIIKEKLALDAHKIDDFRECPYRFYLKYIKNIQTQTKAESDEIYAFGNIIHNVLKKLYENQNPINNKNELESKFEQLLNKETEQNIFVKLDQRLKIKMEYFMYRIKKSSFFNDESKNTAERILTEQKFSTYIENIKVIGVIDRIDVYKNNTFEIIDYKTGTFNTNITQARGSIQLPLYAILAKRSFKIRFIGAAYYDLKKNLRKQYIENLPENLEKFEDEISETIRKIKQGEFIKNTKACTLCPYTELCRTI